MLHLSLSNQNNCLKLVYDLILLCNTHCYSTQTEDGETITANSEEIATDYNSVGAWSGDSDSDV